jgi:hypothetical protein
MAAGVAPIGLPTPPQLIQLGAWLEGLTPERRRLLHESVFPADPTSYPVRPDTFPVWLDKWASRAGGWRGFVNECHQALGAADEGIPAVNMLAVIEGERAEHGFEAFINPKETP